MYKKTALITGVVGQDGSYLAEFLLNKGYLVYGIARKTSNDNLQRIKGILNNSNFKILYGDVTDMSSLINSIETAEPDELYNLAAMSFVGESWNQPLLTFDVVAKGCFNCLEAVRVVKKDIKVYQASSSEIFGNVTDSPQNEKTKINPRNPYGVAKTAAHYAVVNYRDFYGMFCCNGIMYNHESSRRGSDFVTKKISTGVVNIFKHIQKYGDSNVPKILLGNIESSRDWGYAGDFCESMWLMLQQSSPDDYVIATGETHTVNDFLREAFLHVGIADYMKYIEQNIKFMRPKEENLLVGDFSKAKNKLKWEPKVSFKDLVKTMVDYELNEK